MDSKTQFGESIRSIVNFLRYLCWFATCWKKTIISDDLLVFEQIPSSWKPLHFLQMLNIIDDNKNSTKFCGTLSLSYSFLFTPKKISVNSLKMLR